MLLYHRGLGRNHHVTSDRVAAIYARSGWERAEPEQVANQTTRGELDDFAEGQGVDPSRYDTKVELATALADEDD